MLHKLGYFLGFFRFWDLNFKAGIWCIFIFPSSPIFRLRTSLQFSFKSSALTFILTIGWRSATRTMRPIMPLLLEFIDSEKATKFCEIFPLLLSYGVPVKSKGKISQNFVAFSEYMNFNRKNFNAISDRFWPFFVT